MRRLCGMLASLSLFLVIGCGTQSYEDRLTQTLENMRYQKKLNDTLIPAIATGPLKDLDIYVRPPKDLQGPTQAFQLAVVEPGKFDVENSFIEKDKKTQNVVQNLHILARVKKPKPPTAKKGQPAAPAPVRGDFTTDVIDLLKTAYGIELAPNQFKEESKKKNVFRHATVNLDPKTLQIYLFGAKSSPYEIALIFEYPKSEHNTVNPRIGYCLESFAVDKRAKRAFAGATSEQELEDSGDDGSEAASPI